MKKNMMHISFNLLRIKGLYTFRALLAHPQEPLNKRHLSYCVRLMSDVAQLQFHCTLHVSSIICSSSGGYAHTAFGILRAYDVSCGTVAMTLQPCQSQLTLHGHNIPKAVYSDPSEDEQVMLETCRGLLCFSINWMKGVSRWFQYTDILWCTVSKALWYKDLLQTSV
jgi:hypothetical protein